MISGIYMSMLVGSHGGIHEPPYVVPLLDELTQKPVATFALRKTVAAFTDPILKVRRLPANDASRWFSPDATGEISLTELADFLGAGNGGVEEVVDQSVAYTGLSRSWLPVKSSALPLCYKAGAPVLLKGHLAMESASSNQALRLNVLDGILSGVSAGQLLSVVSPTELVNGTSLYVNIKGATADRASVGIYNNQYSATTRIADSGAGSLLVLGTPAVGVPYMANAYGTYSSGQHGLDIWTVADGIDNVSGALFSSGTMPATLPGAIQIPCSLRCILGDQFIFNDDSYPYNFLEKIAAYWL